MKTVNIKGGGTAVIRKAVISDAAGMINFINVVCKESDYLTFGEGEFLISIEEEENMIDSMNKMDNALFLVAEVNGKIVGNLSFNGGKRKRIRHEGEFGVSVMQEYWGMGIGRALIGYLIEWAKATGIVRKINLRTRTDNETAIKLYKSLGFEIEGRLTRDFLINNEFFDSYQMGLAID